MYLYSAEVFKGVHQEYLHRAKVSTLFHGLTVMTPSFHELYSLQVHCGSSQGNSKQLKTRVELKMNEQKQ